MNIEYIHTGYTRKRFITVYYLKEHKSLWIQIGEHLIKIKF